MCNIHQRQYVLTLPMKTQIDGLRIVNYTHTHIIHIQNDASYGRNETESWTGLFTLMECSSQPQFDRVYTVNIMRWRTTALRRRSIVIFVFFFYNFSIYNRNLVNPRYVRCALKNNNINNTPNDRVFGLYDFANIVVDLTIGIW